MLKENTPDFRLYIYVSTCLTKFEAEWRIYVCKVTITGSDNGLSVGQHQAIT